MKKKPETLHELMDQSSQELAEALLHILKLHLAVMSNQVPDEITCAIHIQALLLTSNTLKAAHAKADAIQKASQASLN